MKKIVSVIFIFLGLSLLCPGQVNNCRCNGDQLNEKIFEEKLFGRTNAYSVVGNDIDYFHDWTLGEVLLKNGESVRNEYLRYNGYFDHLLWLRKIDYKTAIINRDAVSGFILYDDKNKPFATFKNMKIKNRITGDSTEVYLQVLAEGHISFYAYRKIMKTPNTGESYQKNIFYLVKNGTYHSVKPGKSGLFRIFSEDKTALRLIMRKNHLRVRKENEMVEAINLYNQSL